MSRKSSCCFGKVSGQPLTEYDSEEDALEGAAYAATKYGSEMVPYQCGICHYWHLSPIKRQTEHASWYCSCVDQYGRRKDGYKTEGDALRRAEILAEQGGDGLFVYQCPESYHEIWHLIKQPFQ